MFMGQYIGVKRGGAILGMLLIVFGFVFVASTALAQFGGLDNLSIILTPERPRPGEYVVARAEHFGGGLDSAYLRWFVNDTLVVEGLGKTTISYTAGAATAEETVVLEVTGPSLETLRAVRSYRPGSIVLLMEGKATAHPFYRGRTLMPLQGLASVVAIPELFDADGRRVSPADLWFDWKENNKKRQNDSGMGKNTLVIAGNIIPRPVNVEVEVRAPVGTLGARGNLTVSATRSNVHLYENNPLLGVLYNKALGNRITIGGAEFGIKTIPYFFGFGGEGAKIAWTINNDILGGSDDTIVVRGKEGVVGQATVAVEVSHPSFILQGARTGLNILFGGEQ